MALLTVRSAAGRLGVGYSTLKQWIYTGKVRTTTTEGGHHRVAESETERLLARYPQSLQGKARDVNRQKGLIVTLSGRNQLRGFVPPNSFCQENQRLPGCQSQLVGNCGDKKSTGSRASIHFSVIFT